MDTMLSLYDRIVNPDLYIRCVNVVACNLISENEIPEEGPEQLSLFVDYEALEKERAEKKRLEDRERRLQRATLLLQKKYGKNAVLKGMNLLEGGTTRERNQQIGGHRAGEDTPIHSRQPKKNDEQDEGNEPKNDGFLEGGDWDGTGD